MKLIPDAIGRKVARSQLLASKNAPSLLFGAGVVGMVGSTVLACRATLKVEEVLDNTQRDLYTCRNMEHEQYSEKDRKKDIAIVYTRGVVSVTKLYAPSVLLGAVSIGCLTKSHNLLQERNAALTAAYLAIDNAYNKYRERVVEKYGEEADREILYESEVIDVVDDETGEVVTTARITDAPGGKYARWFDEANSNWNKPPYDEYNWTFLRQQQNWANDFLRARGHLFLNEVYRMLGMEETSAGALVGWVYDPHNDLGRRPDEDVSDLFVDFGCWNQVSTEPDLFFENGRDGGILCDFNVDGPIWELIDQLKEARKGR